MQINSATAIAHPNIAFIKYWGNQNDQLRIPLNNSISMNLESLETKTTVTFDDSLKSNTLTINGKNNIGNPLYRVSKMIELIQGLSNITLFAKIESESNFPMGSGIASSASAFAALALAASASAGLELSEPEISALARTGSGSASRSIPNGFVEWDAGEDHNSSYSYSIASSNHWSLYDCVAIVSDEHKTTGSTDGHVLASSSPLQNARISDSKRRLDICRQAISDKDFESFANIVELDSNVMHSVMMTSNPNLFYWKPTTLEIILVVQELRKKGEEVCYTIDAGPNVHVMCTENSKEKVMGALVQIPGVKSVIDSGPGGPAKLI